MDEISKIEEVDTLSNTFTIEEQVKNYTLLEKLNLIFDYVKKLQFEKSGTKIFSTTEEELLTARFTGHNGINVDMSEDNNEIFDIRLDEDIIKALEDMNVDIENLTEIVGELTPKVARALLTPVSTPSETKLVAVDNTNSQEMIGVGNDLTLSNGDLQVAQSLYDKINSLSMKPSGNAIYFDLTQSGMEYYAPENGYFAVSWQSSTVTGWMQLETESSITTNAQASAIGQWFNVYIPMKKGEKVTISYDGVGSSYPRFVYAGGI